MAGTTDYLRHSKRGEPVWELAQIDYPRQGSWTEDDYLDREIDARVEFVKGCLEFLPTPTEKHQAILEFFYLALLGFVKPRSLGTVRVAGIRVRTAPDKIREPDVAFMRAENSSKRDNRVWKGADLVLEVVRPAGEGRDRDFVTKRDEYAAAGIVEYWIADFEKGTVTVLALKGKKYVEYSMCKRGEVAKSKLLVGFEVNTKDLLDAE